MPIEELSLMPVESLRWTCSGLSGQESCSMLFRYGFCSSYTMHWYAGQDRYTLQFGSTGYHRLEDTQDILPE